MKKILLSLSLIIIVSALSAQSDKYQKGMEKNISLLDSAKTSEDFTNVAATFERIADAEKTQWLPYYYAAMANIFKGFTDAKANKDEVAAKAEELTAKAEAIEPKSADIAVAKNMIATLHLMVDPMNRWQQYGAEGSKALAQAKQLDPSNPRIYLMEGQTVFGTPAQFGGGKEKAKPLFEKSVALFKTYKPQSNLYPTWGLKSAEAMLARCQ